jgi:putative transcription factor
MECEVCGKQIFGMKRNVVIDRAKLVVCSDCARSVASTAQTYKVQTTVMKTPSTSRVHQRQTIPRESATPMGEDLEVVKNYGSLVREARERVGLSHDELSRKVGVKVSALQKLETEKMVPDQEVATKLERTLKIKLLQSVSSISVDKEFKKPPTKLTLGDIVFVQNEKK